jgi:hypothetical protein
MMMRKTPCVLVLGVDEEQKQWHHKMSELPTAACLRESDL